MKMTFFQTFDDQEYTCVPFDASVWEFSPAYQEYYENLKDNAPSKRPENLTLGWVVNEIGKAYSRDLSDSFYEKQSHREALDEVSLPDKKMLLVFNEAGYLTGKIGYHDDSRSLTVNVMEIYVFGDRRRSIPRQSGSVRKYINGPYIIWYFVALFSKELYGNLGRVLVTLPRDTVFKYLYQAGAMFVEIEYTRPAIETRVKNFSIEYHKRYVRFRMGIEMIEEEWTGALFNAVDLARRIEEAEAQAAALR